MIFVNRKDLPKPAWFESIEVRTTYEAQRAFSINPKNQKAIEQNRFNSDQFLLYFDEDTEKSLVQLFRNKCPFCESLLIGADYNHFTEEIEEELRSFQVLMDRQRRSESKQYKKAVSRGLRSTRKDEGSEQLESYNIGLFRPEYRAMNADATISPTHYWWLGWDWENVFVTCQSCLTAKENRFPVTGKRADFPDLGLTDLRKGLENEETLLIDPCLQNDFSERHILFEDGLAVPITEKGKATITTFGLNRPNLLEIRRIVIADFNEKLEQSSNKKDLLKPSHPFVAAILDATWMAEGQGMHALQVCEEIFSAKLPECYRTESKSDLDTANAYTAEKIKEKKDKHQEVKYNLEKGENLEAYFNQSIGIERIVIQNFKLFKELTIDFPEREEGRKGASSKTNRPWLALLGENGVGKSSISQAIALTLMGQAKIEALQLTANDFIHYDADKATVKVYLLNRVEPIKLTIKRAKGGGRFHTESPQIVMMGYGAIRIQGKEGDSREATPRFIRPGNLFSPLVKLGDGQSWLADPMQVNETLFQQISGRLAELLQLDESQAIIREKDKHENTRQLYIQEESSAEKTPFKFLSSGYKTILAMALDIMIGASELVKNTKMQTGWALLNMAGIVLIDEIGTHLHPRWKMTIVKSLKRTFPSMNFIITTHDPLCLRGLAGGEVVLLQRDENNEVQAITDLPSPQGMRVGQLLTSVFGLNTTMDPDLEPQYNEYYHLLGMAQKTEKQEARLQELQTTLKPDLMLGETLEERLTYQVIAKNIAGFKVSPSKKDIASLSKDTLDELQGLLDL